MKVLTMKRAALLCAGLGTIGAIGAFTFAGTSAQFTASAGPAQDNVITAGTVTINGSSSDTLNVPTMSPGDSARSHYTLAYSGDTPGFVGIDITVNAAAGSPSGGCATPGKYSGYGSGANTLDTLASDCGSATHVGTLPLFNGIWNQGTAVQQPDLGALFIDYGNAQNSVLLYSAIAPTTQCTVGGPTDKITCTATMKNIELKSDYSNTTDASVYEKWVNGSTLTLRLDVNMRSDAGNAFQGSTATVSIAGHAVQWTNNVGGTHAKTAGACDTSTFGSSVVADASGNTYCPISWS